MGLKIKLLILFGFMVNISFAQEICDNGIDDDGDGLIDLNDVTDCNCPPVVIPSLIPNPSFEAHTCCPSTYSQVTCATGWSQATSATSDYFNCGYNFGATTNAGLSPPPDGTGYLGTIVSNGWQEYVGSCLTSPLLAGTAYTINMSIASLPMNGSGGVCNGGVVNYPPIDITIYGSPSCPTFPIGGTGCPSGWTVLGTATYTPVPTWGTIRITFTPATNINSIIIGSPCTLPAGYNQAGGCYAYFLYDNLILQQSSLINSITQTGQWCSNNIQLATTPSGGSTYQWYYNGIALVGETSTTLNVSTNNYGAGNYTITTTTGLTCASASDSVLIPPFPIANYAANSMCNGSPIVFNGSGTLASGTITNWNWNFGDGGTSTLQNPSHTYATDGTFVPTLIITGDNNCKDTISIPINVFPNPSTGFTIGNFTTPTTTLGVPKGICLFDNVNFNDNSSINTGNITSWNWNFGDGSSSTLQNPTHLYSTSGNFNVQLNLVSDSGCIDSVIVPIIINPKPTADFSFTNDCFYNVFTPTNLSAVTPGSIAASLWDFGDGNTSTSFSPSHTYTTDGLFNVNLIAVSDSGCSDTLTKVIERYPKPLASFINPSACLGIANCLVDNSSINPSDTNVSYSWDFGDGSPVGAGLNICHTYTAFGSYNVTLTTTSNHNCIDDTIMPVKVFQLPTPNFISTTVCDNTPPTQFTDLSIGNAGNIATWNWQFGDGDSSLTQNPSHNYLAASTYNVQLTVISDSGCTNVITLTSIVNPKPTADFSFTNDCFYNVFTPNNLSVGNPGNIASSLWNFGDGNTSTTFNPSHTYTTDGLFSVTLIAVSDSGCTDTLTKVIERYPKPLASFVGTNVCLGDSNCFINNSTINPSDTNVSYIWNFGDGSPLQTNQNECHTYANFGTYNVTLIVSSNHNCIDDSIEAIQVYELPIADFSFTTICENTPPTQFTDLSIGNSGNVITWTWNFGVGYATTQNPSYNFGTNGNYTVSLSITNTVGCVDSVTKNVLVKAKPTANFSADTTNGCIPLCINFTDGSQSNAANITSWQWDLGNNTSGVQNPTSNCYNIDGNYSVSLIVQNDLNCYDTLKRIDYIQAFPLPVADFNFSPGNTDIYAPKITFTNLSSNANTWLWNFGDGIADASTYSPLHNYADSGNYLVFLNVWNVYGCHDSTSQWLRIDPVSSIYIPNTFTPDQDGKNETFFFVGYGIVESDFQFYIFDRWGENIYYTQKFEPWDGTYKGLPVPTGVYVYKFVCKDINNVRHTYVGRVTLIK